MLTPSKKTSTKRSFTVKQHVTRPTHVVGAIVAAGPNDGVLLGCDVAGATDGVFEGARDGDFDGLEKVGEVLGKPVGSSVGVLVGQLVMTSRRRTKNKSGVVEATLLTGDGTAKHTSDGVRENDADDCTAFNMGPVKDDENQPAGNNPVFEERGATDFQSELADDTKVHGESGREDEQLTTIPLVEAPPAPIARPLNESTTDSVGSGNTNNFVLCHSDAKDPP